jgi:hypothetical protein
MAYYIFQKSLRSLEEFRKNPHVKIPPKSPSLISQSRAIIKNQILFRKEFFLHIRPNRHSGEPTAPPFPAGRARVLSPSRLARHWRICQKPSLLQVCAARRRRLLPLPPPSGPHPSAPSSTLRRPIPATPPTHLTSLAHPAPPSLYLEMPSQGVNSPALIPQVNPLLNHPPSFNGVNALTPPVTGRYPLSGVPPARI